MTLFAFIVLLLSSGAQGNCTNLVVREVNGTLTKAYVPDDTCYAALPEGTATSHHGCLSSGLETITVAGPSTLSSYSAEAQELRRASILFAEWLNREKGGLTVGTRRLGMQLAWVDDRDEQTQVSNATARALRMNNVHFGVAGHSSSLTAYAALQAQADKKVMVAADAARTKIYEDNSYIFGFLPDAHSQRDDLYRSIVTVARERDANWSGSRLSDGRPCGRAGCLATIRFGEIGTCNYQDIKKQYFGDDVEGLCEKLPKLPRDAEPPFREMLSRLQSKNVTVVELNSLEVSQIRMITEIMEDLDFNVYALICPSKLSSVDFENMVKSGWWQSSYILDSTPWIATEKSAPGKYSKMSSQDFADRYFDTWGEKPSYRAAAQFAALSALSHAIESAASVDPHSVANQLRKISLQEFYGDINFNSTGLIKMPTVTLQAPAALSGLQDLTSQAVYPVDKAAIEFVFPKPTWAHLSCLRSNRHSKRGTCIEGRYVCDEGWFGTTCNESAVDSMLTSSLQASAETGDAILLGEFAVWVIGVLSSIALIICLWRFGRCRQRLVVAMIDVLAEAVSREDDHTIAWARRRLAFCGWNARKTGNLVRGIKRRQSEESGISLSYLLSEEFLELAQRHAGVEDPTFYELADTFFCREQGIGCRDMCPRDDKIGCSFVDTLPPKYRNKSTHFLSWTWGYRVSTVREALQSWLDTQEGTHAEDVFLFMCFFVNNQYRMLVDKTAVGTDVLGARFERQLLRIGRVIAILDTWERPVYLTRAWTIFEQSCAIMMKIPVTMVLPHAASLSLLHEIQKGTEGIVTVQRALTHVDSRKAQAQFQDDERRVKEFIDQHIGFDHVDEQVTAFMISFVGTVIEDHLKVGVSKMKLALSSLSAVSSGTVGGVNDKAECNASKPSRSKSLFAWLGADHLDDDIKGWQSLLEAEGGEAKMDVGSAVSNAEAQTDFELDLAVIKTRV